LASLVWTGLAFQDFATVTTAAPGYPPDLKVATFSLAAKGTWGQFLAFVDAIERYPGVVSLGGPLELPFVGGTAGVEVLNVPIRFYISSPNDPSAAPTVP
jgi:hypothetical protein